MNVRSSSVVSKLLLDIVVDLMAFGNLSYPGIYKFLFSLRISDFCASIQDFGAIISVLFDMKTILCETIINWSRYAEKMGMLILLENFSPI